MVIVSETFSESLSSSEMAPRGVFMVVEFAANARISETTADHGCGTLAGAIHTMVS